MRRAARDAEARLQRIASDRSSVESRLASANLTAAERVELMHRHAELTKLVSAAEKAWLEAAEALEFAAAFR